MKIVYSKKVAERYSANPFENPDRARLSARELQGYDFVEPLPASLEEVSRVHSREHIETVRRKGMLEPALLAAGGACLDRPPGGSRLRPGQAAGPPRLRHHRLGYVLLQQRRRRRQED
ncbi:arginase family protein [Candidatus Methanocrinis natronophilus]|uniref:Histone deacetylase domain-containing protein n=1 Tax=Candidatus Methanocrinis natronophilus TaxID=3033396 RepID=A0ABT5X778_9EURY|nr:hypothetical protein [Candidatus Methanocrinis natronophilus]MDF0590545.1 hypothetical protein [Candidatus Methanocrinis natronophilus]